LAQESKLAKRAEEEQQSGKNKPGRKTASPDAAVDHERKANPTDPASRIMKTRQGHVQGFNAQAIVTADQQGHVPDHTRIFGKHGDIAQTLGAPVGNLFDFQLGDGGKLSFDLLPSGHWFNSAQPGAASQQGEQGHRQCSNKPTENILDSIGMRFIFCYLSPCSLQQAP
jgi:hypothetical protein